MLTLLYLFIALIFLWFIHKFLENTLLISFGLILIVFFFNFSAFGFNELENTLLFFYCPLLFFNFLIYGWHIGSPSLSISNVNNKKRVQFKNEGSRFSVDNIFRGVSIIGAAGSGKTASVLYYFLKHFSKNEMPGLIHDYKDFELTEIAYPLYKNKNIPFYTISPHALEYSYRVNPIAPKYLQGMESEIAVNQISKVLAESLLEKKESSSGSGKFFEDALEGLFSGIIWKLRTDHPKYCTLPHVVLVFSEGSTYQLSKFLESNSISKSMAKAYLSGVKSQNQTAGVVSSFANAIKKIAPRNVMMALSADEVPLDINNASNKAVISLVNHPKYKSTYAPVLSTILNTVIKQMSERHRDPSFLMMEEAPTLRLPNMHEIPATLRSYQIATLYVMQDKIQNDVLYGREAARAILANLSYQFFGKSNDPDTSKYYEQFFEIIKETSRSVSYGTQTLKSDTRVTKSQKDGAKIKAFEFFKLNPGQFVVHADGSERKIQFQLEKHALSRPPVISNYTEKDLDDNYNKILLQSKGILKEYED